MRIHVDWTCPTCGVARLLDGEYGSPYIWAAHVVRAGDTITLMGVSQMPDNPLIVRTALRQWCRENGIKRVNWERYKEAGKRVEDHAV